MKAKQPIRVKASGKEWDAIVIRKNQTSVRVRITSPDWVGEREILRKLGRDVINGEGSNQAPLEGEVELPEAREDGDVSVFQTQTEGEPEGGTE